MEYVPTLNCADPLALGEDIKTLCKCGMRVMHYDIMDGHYVPNFALSMETAAAIRRAFPEVILDVHLMTTDPQRYVDSLKTIGAGYVTFHYSATHFSYRMISQIHAAGMKAGIALNPSEAPELLLPVLPLVDLVLVMSIEPGFSGQPFIPHAMDNVRYLAAKRRELGLDFAISVDGGVTAPLARELRENGADWIILGLPTIFGQPDGIERAFARLTAFMDAPDAPVE